jgi:hypothetical protein
MYLTNRLKAWMNIVTGRNSLVYVMAVLMTVLFGRNGRLPSYNMMAYDGFHTRSEYAACLHVCLSFNRSLLIA